MYDKNIKYFGDIEKDTSPALGRQLTIEYYECNANVLLNKDTVEKTLLKAAEDSGANIISSSFHAFEPQGISGVVIIAESHFTVHAWPEYNYAAVDIFTCGNNIDLNTAINSMKNSFQSDNTVISSDQNRGIFHGHSGQKNAGQINKNPDIHPISWKKEYEKKNPWGVLTSVDIYEADPELMQNAEKIKRFVYELCDLIDMKRFGECRIIHFGNDKKVEGFSMTQMIETSLISGHFANASSRIYIDVFSCKFYEPRQVAEFSTSFFKGDNYKIHIAMRQ